MIGNSDNFLTRSSHIYIPRVVVRSLLGSQITNEDEWYNLNVENKEKQINNTQLHHLAHSKS